MVRHDMVKGIKIPKSEGLSFCEKCVEGKMSKLPFKSKFIRQENYSVCIVMFVGLCLLILLEEKGICYHH